MGTLAMIEQIVSFARCKPLIKQVVVEAGMGLAQRSSESFSFCCLRPGRPIHVQRMAHDRCSNSVLADEAGDGFQISAKRGAVQCKQRLSCQAKGIGDGQANAAVTDIESKDAAGFHPTSLGANLLSRRSCCEKGSRRVWKLARFGARRSDAEP